MSPLIVIFTVLSIICVLIAFRTADSILKYLFENDNSLWDSLNKPAGIFWKPFQDGVVKPEVHKSKVGISVVYAPNEAGKKIVLGMIFKTPNWIKNNSELKSKLMIFRVLVFEWWIFCGWMFYTGVQSQA